MIEITAALVSPFCNRPLQEYLDSFDMSAEWFGRFGISDSPLRAAHFLAQVLHESGGLVHTEESLWYTAARLKAVWPHRFPTVASAAPYAGNPEALANHTYGGRMGNDEDGDGWRYRGRGMIQITGKDMYAKVGEMLGVDLVEDPDQVLGALCAAPAAAAIWEIKGCNEAADADDIDGVTKRINGGLIGLEERTAFLQRLRMEMGI